MSNCHKINRVVISAIIGLSLVLLGSGQTFCPEGWTWYKADYCVKLVTSLVPKEFALGMCQFESPETSLVSFTSADEQTFLTELVFFHNQSDASVWTGGILNAAGNGYQWQDGTVIPRNSTLWDNGYPSNSPKGCIQMNHSTGKLQDVSCSGTRNNVLCQLLAPWTKVAKENIQQSQKIKALEDRLQVVEQLLDDLNTTPPPPPFSNL